MNYRRTDKLYTNVFRVKKTETKIFLQEKFEPEGLILMVLMMKNKQNAIQRIFGTDFQYTEIFFSN